MILLRQFGVNALAIALSPMGLFSKLQLVRTSAGREHIKHRLESWQRGESHVAVKHPLGRWALELCQHNEQRAAAQLEHWMAEGIPHSDLRRIGDNHLGPGITPAPTIPAHHQLRLLAGSNRQWTTHAWLQHLPIEDNSQLEEIDSAHLHSTSQTNITYLLLQPILEKSPLKVDALIQWWQRIKSAKQCIVNEPALAVLLQGMGLENIHAWPISKNTNGWLVQPDVYNQASRELGLPPVRGLQPKLPVVLGDAGPSYQVSLNDQVITLPRWDELLLNNAGQARAQAAWVQELIRSQHSLVLLNPSEPERVTAALATLHSECLAVVLRGQFAKAHCCKN